MMDIVRLEIAGDGRPKGTYGADLDHLVVNRRAILTPIRGESASNFDPSPGW